MGELYSNFGRTNVWYALSLTVLEQCLRLRFTNPKTLEPLDVMVFIWLLYFILSVNSTPKYGWCFTVSSIWLFILYSCFDLIFRFPMFINIHLSTLNFICQVLLQSNRLFRSSCRITWSWGESICRYTTQSSANSLMIEFIFSAMSLIYIKNRVRPNTVPWGTPDVTNLAGQFVHDIISSLDGAMNGGHKQTDLIIMDLAKVPHRRLFHKLHYYGISGSTHKWISSWLLI